MFALKPWQFARVQAPERGRWFIGELVSFPTPEDTILVRTLPGVAGSAIEVPTSDVHDPNSQAFKWMHYATVAGKGFFPWDMLRYDMCVPATFKIDANGRAQLDEGFTALVVARAMPHKSDYACTTERWRSFGWVVTAQRVERITKELN